MEASADYFFCIRYIGMVGRKARRTRLCTINVKFRAKTKMFNSTIYTQVAKRVRIGTDKRLNCVCSIICWRAWSLIIVKMIDQRYVLVLNTGGDEFY